MEKHKPATSIMLVERDELALQVFEWLFKKSGYLGELLMFTDPAQANEYLNTHKLPDLLITDFFLNEQEEFSVLLRAQELSDSWNKQMPIVILGDFVSDRHKIPSGLRADFVLKPLRPDVAKEWLARLK